ncbi:uncharacterized protein LOC141903071 [Tubulanus polymorphus]|uniref:uncharacterized protein LOC141903071 n=1 Tax=Tubulanus polymorphus TaxID=672921 RepID=UPI003DA4B85F
MSLNTAHAHGGVLIYCGERILIYYDGVEFCIEPDQPHQAMRGTNKGRVYLTTHRVIYNSKNRNDVLQSFSIPFTSMRKIELEQPIFGSNYIKGKVIAETNGNWTGSANFKLYFTTGGAIEFGQAMLEAGKRVIRNRPAQPPPYAPPSGRYYQAPPPAYTPMYQDPMYSFVPHQTFPTAPPANGVYMTDAPPPYPGINPNEAAYAPPHPPGFVAGGNGVGAPPPPYQMQPNNQFGGYPPPQNGAYPPPQNGAYPPPQNGAYPPPQNGAYPPPQNGAYPPPQNGAYPPPQNGAYPPPQNGAYPPPQNGAYGAGYPLSANDAKAIEASGYYNPNQPNTAFVQQRPDAVRYPPSYDEATKKSQ